MNSTPAASDSNASADIPGVNVTADSAAASDNAVAPVAAREKANKSVSSFCVCLSVSSA